MTDQLNPLPQGSGAVLRWQGGTANNDPTNALNWSPHIAPAMATNQTLIMEQGTMDLGGGNLQANQLHVQTVNQTAIVNLRDHGSLDAVVDATHTANLLVNMTGGGTANVNIFADMLSSAADITVSLDDISAYSTQAQMGFGKLTVHGGATMLQGQTVFQGTQVLLDTKLSGSATVDVFTSTNGGGRLESTWALPSGVIANVSGDAVHKQASGLVQDHPDVTPGAKINLTYGYVEDKVAATSYTNNNGELDLFKDGVKVAAMDITSFTGPLNVGVANGNTYVYNCDVSAVPTGASASSGGMSNSLVADMSGMTALPMHS